MYALIGLSDAFRKLAGPPDHSITSMEVWIRLFDKMICSLGLDSCLLWQLISVYANAESHVGGLQHRCYYQYLIYLEEY